MDVISMTHYDEGGIEAILGAIGEVRQALHDPSYDRDFFIDKHERPVRKLLEGTKVATMFVENSTRTNFSSRIAAMESGALVDGFATADHTSFKKGETWTDAAAMFACYGYDILVMRTTTEGIPQWTSEAMVQIHAQLSRQYEQAGLPFSYRVPRVVNGGDGKHEHPTQCWLDLRTFEDIAKMKGLSLKGLPVALTNDLRHSRVQGSIMSVAPKIGLELHLAYPPNFGPSESQIRYLDAQGVNYTDHGDDWQAAMKAAVVCQHSRPQKGRVAPGENLLEIKDWGSRTRRNMNELGPGAALLTHPRPVDSVLFEEIHHSLRFDDRDWSMFQASNGPPARTGLFGIILDRMNLDYDLSAARRDQSELEVNQISFAAKASKNTHRRTGSIQENGIVMDHIPAGYGRRLAGLLGLEEEGVPVTLGTHVQGRRGPKDILKIFGGYELSTEQYEAAQLIAPEVTICTISGGQVTRKEKVELGGTITDRVKCANDPCVTNVVIEHVPTRHKVLTKGPDPILQCGYCETTDTVSQVFADKRFKYI